LRGHQNRLRFRYYLYENGERSVHRNIVTNKCSSYLLFQFFYCSSFFSLLPASGCWYNVKQRTKIRYLLYNNAPANRSVLVKDFVAGCSWFLLVTSSAISMEGNGAFVTLLTSSRMRRKSWKCFHKMASRNVSNNFTVAGKSVYLHKGAILKEM